VDSKPTLAITKDANSLVIEPSGLVSYTIIVSVGGNAPATPLNVSDVLPDELDFVSADPQAAVNQRVVDGQEVAGGQILAWTIDSVQPTETAIFEVTARLIPGPAGEEILTNTAAATTPGTKKVVDTEDVKVNANANVIIEKLADRTVVEVGDQINYTINVTNDGDGAALGVVVTDELPSTLDYVSSDPEAAVNGRTLTWQVGRMTPGETRSFLVAATANAAGTPINHATVDGANVLSGSAEVPVDVAARPGSAPAAPTDPSEPSGPLAYTGANLWWMMLIGAAMAAVGLVLIDRRRRMS
jgi:uncharacterized repeat protein (TIGR01451 family)/LPXTG-motif cell wall-anchored protein